MRRKRQHFEKDALAPSLDGAHSVSLVSHPSSLWDRTHSSLPLMLYPRAFTSIGKHQELMGKGVGGAVVY